MNAARMSEQLVATQRKPTVAATCRVSPCLVAPPYIRGATQHNSRRKYDIFAGTFWKRVWAKPANRQINQNRKRLVDDWRLTAHADAPDPHRPLVDGRHEYDFPELYHDETGGLVLVVSNWGPKPPSSALGMREIPPVFNRDAKSYARRFPNANALKKALQRAMRERG